MSITPIVLDPVEIDPSRTQLDLNSNGLAVAPGGPDWGDAEITQFLADAKYGSRSVDYRVPNRTIKIPLLIGVPRAGDYDYARAALQQKVALLRDRGGTIKRGNAPLFADIVDAKLTLPDTYTHLQLGADVVLELTALPDFYGAEVSGTQHSETTAPVLTFTEADIEGDFPGRVRVKVDNLEPTNHAIGALWAFRCRHYDSAATARPFYEAETLTPLDAAAVATVTGASGGATNNAVKHASLPGGAWCPVLSTEIAASSSHLTHKGSYRVWACMFSASATPQVKLLWDVGDLAFPTENDPVRLPGANAFYLVDLGTIRLDESPVGAHRWLGVIQAKADAQGDPLSVDWLFFQSLDDGAGRLVAAQPDSTTLGVSVTDSPSTGADDSAVGSVAWSNPGNVHASDDVYASAPFAQGSGTSTSHYLKATNFGFAIPAGATISGIVVSIERRASSPLGGISVKDAHVKLIKAGAIQATDRADTATPWPSSDTTRDYGGSTDLWGTTWTAADINNSGFGVALSVTGVAGNTTDETAYVDTIRITVSYTTSGGFTETVDAVVYATRSAELRTDGMYRQANDASGAYPPIPSVIGDLPRVPVSGLEGLPVELSVLLTKGDFSSQPHGAALDTRAQLFYRPCWLFFPGDSS